MARRTHKDDEDLRSNEAVQQAQAGTSLAGANEATSVSDTPKKGESADFAGAEASRVEGESASDEERQAVAEPEITPGVDVTSLAAANSGTSVGAFGTAGAPGNYAGVFASEREVEGGPDRGEPERIADPNLPTSLAGQNAQTSVSDTPIEDVPAGVQGAVASQKEAAPGRSYGSAPNASF